MMRGETGDMARGDERKKGFFFLLGLVPVFNPSVMDSYILASRTFLLGTGTKGF